MVCLDKLEVSELKRTHLGRLVCCHCFHTAGLGHPTCWCSSQVLSN